MPISRKRFEKQSSTKVKSTPIYVKAGAKNLESHCIFFDQTTHEESSRIGCFLFAYLAFAPFFSQMLPNPMS